MKEGTLVHLIFQKLNVVCTCMACCTSSIEVPADYALEQASTYVREHIDEIPIGSGLEYIRGSDGSDEEHCGFEKEGGAG